MDTATVISIMINLFQNLQILGLSDCKLNLSCDNENSRDESSFKRLFSSIKSKIDLNLDFFKNKFLNNTNNFKASNIKELDLSYNKFDAKFLTDLIENLPECKIEHLNISNSLNKRTNDKNESLVKYEEKKVNLYESLIKFIPFNLIFLSIRNMNFNKNQTNDIIK